MARLSERDAAAWRELSRNVAERVEPRLAAGVAANRMEARVGRTRLRPLGPALATARRHAAHLATRSPLVLRTDVSDFYPTVTPELAHRTLRELIGAADARRIASMLDGWGSEGYAGLPIGPPGSAVLANAVLRPVDASISETRFLRWVDDYLVAVREERQAAEVLERLDAALASCGLRRNERKTVVVAGGGAMRWLAAPSGG